MYIKGKNNKRENLNYCVISLTCLALNKKKASPQVLGWQGKSVNGNLVNSCCIYLWLLDKSHLLNICFLKSFVYLLGFMMKSRESNDPNY